MKLLIILIIFLTIITTPFVQAYKSPYEEESTYAEAVSVIVRILGYLEEILLY